MFPKAKPRKNKKGGTAYESEEETNKAMDHPAGPCDGSRHAANNGVGGRDGSEFRWKHVIC